MTTLITVKTFSGGNRYVDSSSFARNLCRIAVLPDYGSQKLTAADRGRIQSKKEKRFNTDRFFCCLFGFCLRFFILLFNSRSFAVSEYDKFIKQEFRDHIRHHSDTEHYVINTGRYGISCSEEIAECG